MSHPCPQNKKVESKNSPEPYPGLVWGSYKKQMVMALRDHEGITVNNDKNHIQTGFIGIMMGLKVIRTKAMFKPTHPKP